MEKKTRRVARRRQVKTAAINTEVEPPKKKKRWKVGDTVYFTRYPGEEHTIIGVVPGNRRPEKYATKLEAGFLNNTPIMNKQLNLPYQMGGTSYSYMKTWQEPSYFVAGIPDKRWGWIIHVRRARSEELSEEPLPDPDGRSKNLYQRK